MSKDADAFDNRFKILLTGDRSEVPLLPRGSSSIPLGRDVPCMTEGRRGCTGREATLP